MVWHCAFNQTNQENSAFFVKMINRMINKCLLHLRSNKLPRIWEPNQAKDVTSDSHRSWPMSTKCFKKVIAVSRERLVEATVQWEKKTLIARTSFSSIFLVSGVTSPSWSDGSWFPPFLYTCSWKSLNFFRKRWLLAIALYQATTRFVAW